MSRGLTISCIAVALSLHAAAAADAVIPTDALDAGIGGETPPDRPPAPARDGGVTSGGGITSSARPLGANPLWAIPLTGLAQTRNRPIFSPSRRPPPPAVDARPVYVPPPPRKKDEVQRPPLSLVGTVASNEEGFGIFLDDSTKQALRLKLGEDYQGWKLRTVRGHEVSMEKDRQITVLALPAPSGQIVKQSIPLNADGSTEQAAMRRR